MSFRLSFYKPFWKLVFKHSLRKICRITAAESSNFIQRSVLYLHECVLNYDCNKSFYTNLIISWSVSSHRFLVLFMKSPCANSTTRRTQKFSVWFSSVLVQQDIQSLFINSSFWKFNLGLFLFCCIEYRGATYFSDFLGVTIKSPTEDFIASY